MRAAPLAAVFSCFTLASGCDDGAADHTDARGLSSCGTWRCGYNSAEVNGRSLQSLHLGGAPNADGVKVVGFQAPAFALLGGPWTLTVENDEFVAKRGQSRLRGKQLVGGIIYVQGGLLGLPLPITILGYEEVPSWAAGADPIAAYTLVSPDVSSLVGVKNVCSGSLLDPLTASVTVLGGETYDNEKKEVEADRAGWFTLACAGSAAAKMKLMGYAPQTEYADTGHPSTVAQRQATLKMITADFCGKGVAYTENGTAVVWENRDGTVDSSNWHTPDEVEAIWTDKGALCLDAKRLASAQVACSLPSCDGLDVEDGEWITHTALD